MTEPALVLRARRLRARRLRAARGAVVARDVSLTASPGDVVATDLGLVPFAVVLAAAALIWPLVTQGSQPHPGSLDLKIVELHLAAALFGAGLGSVLALIERAGWRLISAVALFLLLFVIRPTPLTPLLRMSTHSSTLLTPVGDQVAWLALPGLLLVAAATFLATARLA